MLIDSGQFRRILSHYPTGVCVAATALDSVPFGMVIGSFSSVSLEPALVSFAVKRGSRTFARIRQADHFCVSILGEDQHSTCLGIFAHGAEGFADVSYRSSPMGAPIIADCVAWFDCRLHAVHDAGDHLIVLGRVVELSLESSAAPLIFHRGGYGRVDQLRPDLPCEADEPWKHASSDRGAKSHDEGQL